MRSDLRQPLLNSAHVRMNTSSFFIKSYGNEEVPAESDGSFDEVPAFYALAVWDFGLYGLRPVPVNNLSARCTP